MGQLRIERLQTIERLHRIELLQVIELLQPKSRLHPIERHHPKSRLHPIERQAVDQQLIGLPGPDRWGRVLLVQVAPAQVEQRQAEAAEVEDDINS